MATHPSILAWRIPWTEEPGGLQSMGLRRVECDWVTEHRHSMPVKLKISTSSSLTDRGGVWGIHVLVYYSFYHSKELFGQSKSIFLYSEELITKKHLTIFFFFQVTEEIGTISVQNIETLSLCFYVIHVFTTTCEQSSPSQNSYSARWERFLFIRLWQRLAEQGMGLWVESQNTPP